MMRVLLIEDDRELATSLGIAFEGQSILVTHVGNSADGLHYAEYYEFDLIVMEWMKFDIDGAALLRFLRGKEISTPVIVVTYALSSLERCLPFECGADDCLEKPFHFDELIARINAVVRRTNGNAAGALKFGELTIDMDHQSVAINGRHIHMTGKEYSILECLARRRGRIVTKEQLLSHLYGGRDEPELKIIDVFICKIRHKLQAAEGHSRWLETAWGRGYVLREPSAEEENRETREDAA